MPLLVKKIYKNSIVPIFLFFFILFLIKGITVIDPDFGWHLKTGEYILKHGLPTTDPFSYTMANYPFIDHEWLTNVVIAFFYPLLQREGLAVVFTLLTILCMVIFKKKPSVLFLIVVMEILLSFNGIRPQVISWFLLVVFIRLLSKGTISTRSLTGLIFLQALWTNLHGGFFLGILLISIFYISKTAEEKKFSWYWVIIILAFLGATLINPYGIHIWSEVGNQLGDLNLRWSIREWMPAVFFLNALFWFYAMISLGFFIRFYKELTLFEKLCYMVFFIGALLSSRNIPLWILASLPILQKNINGLYNATPQNLAAKKRLEKAKRILIITTIVIISIQLTIDIVAWPPFLEDGVYPKKAIKYIQRTNSSGNIMALYEWGGYLIWKLPERKVFIDGRMPSWRWTQDDPRYSNYAFKDHNIILNAKKGYEKLLQKYNVSYILVNSSRLSPKIKRMAEKIYEDKTATLYKMIQFSPKN